MYQINIGVYIGSDEANFLRSANSSSEFRKMCLDFRGSLQVQTGVEMENYSKCDLFS